MNLAEVRMSKNWDFMIAWVIMNNVNYLCMSLKVLSRDIKGVGVAYKVNHLKTSHNFSRWQWGSIDYAQTSFQTNPKHFQKVATEFTKKIIFQRNS